MSCQSCGNDYYGITFFPPQIKYSFTNSHSAHDLHICAQGSFSCSHGFHCMVQYSSLVSGKGTSSEKIMAALVLKHMYCMLVLAGFIRVAFKLSCNS